MSHVLKQKRKRKTSSKATEFFKRLRKEVEDLPPDQAVVAFQAKLDEIPLDELRLLNLQAIDECRPQYQRQLLVDLANLPDKGEKWFSHKYGPMYFSVVADAELMKLRDEVRSIWNPDGADVTKQAIIDAWLSDQPPLSPRWHNRSPLWVVWRYRQVLPNPKHIRATLALALVQNADSLAICRNPECSARYFLAKRRGQKYCERGECTKYAQQQYALAWWNKEGKQRRESKRANADRLKPTKAKSRQGRKSNSNS